MRGDVTGKRHFYTLIPVEWLVRILSVVQHVVVDAKTNPRPVPVHQSVKER